MNLRAIHSAPLYARRLSASIRASMQAFQEYCAGLTERHRNEFAGRVRAGEFNNQSEKVAYLQRCRAVLAEAEAEWKVLQVSVVAGAGSNLHLLPEQVKMVAGTGIDHNLQSTPVKMVAGGCNHHYLRPTNSHFLSTPNPTRGEWLLKIAAFIPSYYEQQREYRLHYNSTATFSRRKIRHCAPNAVSAGSFVIYHL